METAETLNYYRIAEAINYLKDNFKRQPDLDEVAQSIHLSPYHFQRMFTQWAGISPKKFLQYLSIDHAKQVLKQQASLSDAAYDTGFSGTSRLHDLFVNIEGMTPAEYKNGGKALHINFSYAETIFGNILVASTPKGICYMAFADDKDEAFKGLYDLFPYAAYYPLTDAAQQNALQIFRHDWSHLPQIKLHLKGTPFQLKVWETLLKIPLGGLNTYQAIAQHIRTPLASRAVGSAIGANPVAFLIPCHRVIKATGRTGQYHWGINRKTAIIGWEAARAGRGEQ